MKLEAAVRKNVMEYPTLFRVVGDEAASRLMVLSHMFLGYGTAMEWRPSGYLADSDDRGPYGKRRYRRYPDGYFTKSLFTFRAPPAKLPELKAALAGRFWYRRRDEFDRSIRIVFEGNRAEAEALADRFRLGDGSTLDGWTQEAADARGWPDSPIGFYPHSDICYYSPIAELAAGRTDSTHGDDFDLDGIVQPDYIAGCRDVAEATLDYYGTPSRYRTSFRYPGRGGGCFRGRDRWTKWRAHVADQTGYCRRFLEKFGSSGSERGIA